MEKNVIDRKFQFTAVNPCNGKIYTEKDAVVFCAKDLAFPAALLAYHDKCKELGCEEEQLESVKLMLDRVLVFQAINQDLVKLPDTESPCEIDRCLGGIFDK